MPGTVDTLSEQVLTITRVFDAPRSLVFRAWTDPVLAPRWWVPRGFTLLSCEMEVRPGGAWRRRMRSADGTVIGKFGVYCEIVAPERLVFTYADEDDMGSGPETVVTVTLAERDGRTVLTLRQTGFESAVLRDSHETGWSGAMEHLADYLTTLEKNR
jgi:uncharacterized protein YndB with AHSA1/START domain